MSSDLHSAVFCRESRRTYACSQAFNHSQVCFSTEEEESPFPHKTFNVYTQENVKYRQMNQPEGLFSPLMTFFPSFVSSILFPVSRVMLGLTAIHLISLNIVRISLFRQQIHVHSFIAVHLIEAANQSNKFLMQHFHSTSFCCSSTVMSDTFFSPCACGGDFFFFFRFLTGAAM